MTKLKILEYPEKLLIQKTKPVEFIDDEILKLIEDMAQTMFEAPGVGLAATQVGSNKRIIVYDNLAGLETQDSSKDSQNSSENSSENQQKRTEYKALINPEILSFSGSIVSEEGCLSVPELNSDVERSQKITVKGLNTEGKKVQFDVQDVQAIILQHEIDHLNGILFIDRISVLKRNMYKKRMKKRMKKG